MKKMNDRSVCRTGAAAPLILIAIVAVAMIGGGLYYYLMGGAQEIKINPIIASAKKGEFISQVVDQGEVQSSDNEEIRCQARARNGSLSVISVVPEGTLVKGGDFLVELDASAFETDLEGQKIAVATAETSVIQAEADLIASQESLKEYNEGIYVENLKKIENDIADAKSQIATAQQDLTLAKSNLEHSRKLQGKGYATLQQLESMGYAVKSEEFKLQKATNLLSLGEKQKEVLENITRRKETVQLESDIKAAVVKLRNQKAVLATEEGQLAEIQEQIEKCDIRVPEGVQGQVVYAKESSRSGNDWVLEEGTTVRERQVLVRLPNPDKMEVKALINEQSITRIEVGMPATIKVDALNNLTLKGVVTRVSQYAEQSGWMSSSIRKYAVFVSIIDPPPALKPGMNASVTIQVRYEEEALTAPIQTVYGVQDQHFCLVQIGEDLYETRKVEIDGDNSQLVLIKGGLAEGERLVMNPGAYKEKMDLPELKLDTKIELTQEESQQAKAAQESSDSANDPADGQAARGQPGGGRPGGGQPGGGRPGGGRPGGGAAGGGGFNMSAIVDRTMERYDTNGDGNIDADETANIDGRAKDMVTGADSNSDGSVSRAELEKAMAAMMSRMQQGGGAGGPGGGQ